MSIKINDLHFNNVLVDVHNQIMFELAIKIALGEKNALDNYYAPRLFKGGVNVINMIVGGNTPASTNMTDLLSWGAMDIIDMLETEVSRSKHFKICTSYTDISNAFVENKIAIVLKLEGSRAFDGKPDEESTSLLRVYHKLGVRMVGLVAGGRSKIGDGSGERRTGGGLTTFGVKVVRELDRLGMIIDVLNLTDPGFYDVLSITNKPILDSSSNVYDICAYPKNLSKERILAMGKVNGVIGINFLKGIVKQYANELGQKVSFDDVIKHIDYIANLIGTDHIALGPNLDNFETLQNIHRAWSPIPGSIEGQLIGKPQGSPVIDKPSCFEEFYIISEKLIQHGYSDDDVKKILGGNMMRLYKEIL
jgi:membrane dipeptidase